MLVIVTVDDGEQYKHNVVDSNIKLASLLADICVRLQELNKLNTHLESAPLEYLEFSYPVKVNMPHQFVTRLLIPQDLNITLGKLELENECHIRLNTIRPLDTEDSITTISVTTLLHFLTDPQTADKEATKKLINTFIKDGKDFHGNSASHLLARMGDLKEVKFPQYINGKNAGFIWPEENVEGFDNTALHVACFHRHSRCASALVDAGADLDETNSCLDDTGTGIMPDKTPLHLSAKKCDPRTIKILLDAKANVNAKDYKGFTPLHSAISNAQPSPFSLATIRLLLGYGEADVNADNSDRVTPLMTICGKSPQNPEALATALYIIAKLIGHQANLNHQNLSGHTALHYIFMNKDWQSNYSVAFSLLGSYMLVTAGANLNIKNEKGKTPLQLAPSSDYIKNYLISMGALQGIENLNSPQYLKLYIGPLFTEIQPLLLTTIMESLLERIPKALISIIQSYVIFNDIELMENSRDDNIQGVLQEFLAVAKNRAEVLFNQQVRENKVPVDLVTHYQQTLEKSELLREKSIKNFLQLRTILSSMKTAPEEKKKTRILLEPKLPAALNTMLREKATELYYQSRSVQTSPGDQKLIDPLEATPDDKNLGCLPGFLSFLAEVNPKKTTPSPIAISEQDHFEQTRSQLLAATKVLQKDTDTIQRIKDVNDINDFQKYIDLNALAQELAALSQKLDNIPKPQRTEAFTSTIEKIQAGISCIERLNDYDGKLYHSVRG